MSQQQHYHLFGQQYLVLLVIIGMKFALQYYFINPVYELHRDEFLHLDQAFHPAWGYISVPPLTSWVAYLIYLAGGTLFWIRFAPALFGAATIVLIWLTVDKLKGGLLAKILAASAFTFSVFARLNVLFQPNAFDIFASTLLFYLAVSYVTEAKQQKLYWLAIAFALGFYNKYNILFPLAAILGGIAFTEHRTIFSKKALYWSIALAILLILPNLIWQMLNNFPVISHMEELKSSQLIYNNRFSFWKDQVAYGMLGIFTLPGLLALLFNHKFRSYRFVAFAFLMAMTLYTISRAKSYYSAGFYPVLMAFTTVYLERALRNWRTPVLALLTITNILFFYGVSAFLMPVLAPEEIAKNRSIFEKIGLLRWEDGKNHAIPQDFADMVGWREMADKAWIAYQEIPESERDETLIFCDNYGQTGALNYYNRSKMPAAYSFNTDYIYWIPTIKKITNILIVGELPHQSIIDLFSEKRIIGEVINPFSREKGTKIILLLGAKPEVTGLFYKMADERKLQFDIF